MGLSKKRIKLFNVLIVQGYGKTSIRLPGFFAAFMLVVLKMSIVNICFFDIRELHMRNLSFHEACLPNTHTQMFLKQAHCLPHLSDSGIRQWHFLAVV